MRDTSCDLVITVTYDAQLAEAKALEDARNDQGAIAIWEAAVQGDAERRDDLF